MAARGTALVPTLINVETFPGIAASASKFPTYAAHMRELHAGASDVVRRAVEAGVPVYAGTDAGGGIAHGRIADEVVALHRAGHPDALGAASWTARAWLGRPSLEPGAPADLAVYREDPRAAPRGVAGTGAGDVARPRRRRSRPIGPALVPAGAQVSGRMGAWLCGRPSTNRAHRT